MRGGIAAPSSQCEMGRAPAASISTGEHGTTALLSHRRRCGGTFYLYSLVAVASVGGLLFGYDTGVVSGAMILIVPALHLSANQHEAIVSSTTGFAALGALCSGSLNRRCGRRPVLIWSAIIFTAGAVVMALCGSFLGLLAGRCIVGVAIGLASTTVPLYLAELAPASVRGRLVATNNACIVFGQVVAAVTDGFFSADHESGWRWMLGLGGVPSALQLVGLLFLPESPRWLLGRGRAEQARAVLRKLREGGSAVDVIQSAEDLDAEVEAEVDEIISSLGAERGVQSSARSAPPIASAAATAAEAPVGAPSRVSFADLWAVRRQLRLGVGLATLQQLVGINTIMYYSASILKDARLGSDELVIWLAAPVAAAQLVGCLLGMHLIDRVGRRSLVLFSLAGVALSLALEGVAFGLGEWYCPLPPPSAPPPPAAQITAGTGQVGLGAPMPEGLCDAKGWVALLGMVTYLLCFGVGMAPIPWTVNAEIYPNPVRSTCMAISTGCNWAANLLISATFLNLQDAITTPGTFWLYGGVAVCGAAWLCLSMPETRGLSLEQIEQLFQREQHELRPLVPS